MMDPSRALRELLDKQAIAEVLYRYARACDRADEAMLRSCFHADARNRHGGYDGTAEGFCGFAMKIILSNKRQKHLITNVLVELDGDVAMVESHYFAYHRRVDRKTQTEEDYFTGGRYLDRFERREEEWRIAARVGLIDFERFDPVSERGFAKLAPHQLSRQRPDDDLYALMPSLRGRASSP